MPGYKSAFTLSLAILATMVFGPHAMADAYAPPVCGGGWTYVYHGDEALANVQGNLDRTGSLDGQWGWYCGSSLQSGNRTWDGITESGGTPGTAPGIGSPGGVAALMGAGGVTYLRMQDTGDPRDYGVVQPTNQKFMFGHDIASDVGEDVARGILDFGATLCFRIRLATPATADGGLDNQYPKCSAQPCTPQAWPAGGDGYLEGVFAIRQDLGDQLLTFGYALASDKADNTLDVMAGRQGLVFNRLNDVLPNNKSNPNNTSTSGVGSMNILDVADVTQWHEFWVTITKGGAGTHRLTVWMDGSLVPAGTFDVTAYTEQDFPFNSLAMGMGYSNASGAVDIDFFKYAVGASPPAAANCLLTVLPTSLKTIDVVAGQPAQISLTVSSCAENAGTLTYSVQELDDTQTATDVPWLTPDKIGGSVSPGGTDTINVTLNTSLAPGLHTGYLKFTDTCDPSNVTIRRIDLNVLTWGVSGCYEVYRPYLLDFPAMTVPNVTYRITNGGAGDLVYTVASDATWLTPDKSGGTIPPGGYADVVGTINPGGQGAGNSYTGRLTFTNTADMTTIIRRVRMRVSTVNTVYVYTYLGDKDPTAEGSAGVSANGTGQRFIVRGGTLTGAVEADPDAQNRRVWRIQDAANDNYVTYQTVLGTGTTRIDVRGEIGVTLLARLKVYEQAGLPGPQMLIWNGDADGGATAYGYWGGAGGGITELLRGAPGATSGSNGFVVVRMTSIGRQVSGQSDMFCSRRVRMYLNEHPAPVVDTDVIEYSSGINEGFGFGAGGTTGTMDIAFDWVSGTNAGAFAPGEEVAVIGKSLVPEFCHVPFADTPPYDGDVDMDDFGAFQACVGTYTPACRCFDHDGDLDVDDADFGAFKVCASGPSIPANPDCGG